MIAKSRPGRSRTIARIALSLLIVLIIALALIGNYFVEVSIPRKTPEQRKAQFGGNVEGINPSKQEPADQAAREVLTGQTELGDHWSNTTISQAWAITSDDGLKLFARY